MNPTLLLIAVEQRIYFNINKLFLMTANKVTTKFSDLS